MVKIKWTTLSLEDLSEIFAFIAADSRRFAIITSNKIYQNVQSICRNPLLGRIVPEFNEATIREVIEGNYRIIYKIINEK